MSHLRVFLTLEEVHTYMRSKFSCNETPFES